MTRHNEYNHCLIFIEFFQKLISKTQTPKGSRTFLQQRRHNLARKHLLPTRRQTGRQQYLQLPQPRQRGTDKRKGEESFVVGP